MKNLKSVNLERFEQKLKEVENSMVDLRETIGRKKQELEVLFARLETLQTIHEQAKDCLEYGKDYTDGK